MSILAAKRKRDVKRQRGQFLAVSVTIALGVMLFATTYDAYRNLDGSYNQTYDRLAFADITVIGADPSFADTANGIAGVGEAISRLQADLPMRVNDEQPFLGRLVGMPPDRQPSVNKIDVIEGDYLDPADSSTVVIEEHMAEQFEIGPGDTVQIFAGGEWAEATVTGIAVSAEYIWPARDNQDIFPPPGTFGVVFVSDDIANDFPANAGRNDVLITYTDDAEVEGTDRRVTDAAETAGASDSITLANHPSNSTLLLDVNGFASMSVLFPALFMTAAGMAAYVLLTRIVFAQRGIIGTLRASGLSKKMMLRHYLSYGVRLGAIAGAIGLVLGMAAAYAVTGVYTAQLDIPDTVRSFHWETPIIGMAFAFGAAIFGVWAPARRAFKVSPAEAMRGSTPPGRGKTSWLEKVLPPLRKLPVRWLMIFRGMGRNKRRSVATVLGVVLGLTLIMVSWGMMDTMILMIDRQFNEVSLQDADVVLNTPVTEQVANEVGTVTGVTRGEVVTRIAATAGHDGQTFATSLTGYDNNTVMHGFPNGIPFQGVLAGARLADEIGIEVGDHITIALTNLDVTLVEEVVGFLDEPVGVAVYMERGNLTDKIGEETVADPTVSHVQALFATNVADRDSVIDDISDLDEVAVVSDARVLVNTLQDFLGFFYVFVGLMLVLGGAMAFALMYNAISVNVAEQSGEFATMRANGLSHRSVASLIGFENILLTIIGVIPGAIVGYLVGVYFMTQFSVDAFTLDFEMRPMSIAISIGVMILTAVISLIPAIRRVKKIDIGATVRERAI